ncbi:MAG: hypothetical protein JNL42_06105 [Anaerolineae bacterium]|nr:hypothetical protein [Anaerolineae bacterium]
MAVSINKTPYGGWQNCYTLSNGKIEAVVTADVGPRVIRFSLPGGANLFYENPKGMGVTGGDKWVNFGGHRLWHSPEDPVRTYSPDNSPVKVDVLADGVILTQPVEPDTGIEKQIELRVTDGAPHMKVIHRLRNTNQWAVTFAPWALSVMASGGTAVVPLPPRGSHTENLLPKNNLALWAYTNMSDPRWTWGNKYVLLRSVPGAVPQKIGASVPDGWAGYVLGGALFLKMFSLKAGATYPDYGSNCEVFTNDVMLEVESLGPLAAVAPGATVEHVEDWLLFGDASAPARDIDVETQIMPRVHQAIALTGR